MKFFIVLLSIVTLQGALAASSSGGRGKGNFRGLRQDEPNINYAGRVEGASSSPPWVASSLDPLVRSEGLNYVLMLPDLSKEQMEAVMERHLNKLHFNVLNPDNLHVEPVSLYQGHGGEHYFGHPANKDWLYDVYVPGLPSHFQATVAKNIDTSQRAMGFLHKHKHAAITHEPSGTIYLSGTIDPNDREWLHFIKDQQDRGFLPKITKGNDGCLHFKTSKAVKKGHRNPNDCLFEKKWERGYHDGNGRTMEDETSSEGEV